MTEEKKLRLTLDELQDLLVLQQQLDRLQEKCKACLWRGMTSEVSPLVSNNIELLQFQELNKSSIDRSTDGGILNDDLQKFLRYKTAMGLVTKTADEEEQELSDQLESVLSNITSLMRRVLQENSISPSSPAGLSGLGARLDKNTREFLEVFSESDKENKQDTTDSNQQKDSVVHDVRNYVILKYFGDALLLFKRDLGHLSG